MLRDVPQNLDLAALADEVHKEHILRLDVDWTEPLVPRPYRRRPRPQTSIIANAAKKKIMQREIAASVSDWLTRAAPVETEREV